MRNQKVLERRIGDQRVINIRVKDSDGNALNMTDFDIASLRLEDVKLATSTVFSTADSTPQLVMYEASSGHLTLSLRTTDLPTEASHRCYLDASDKNGNTIKISGSTDYIIKINRAY